MASATLHVDILGEQLRSGAGDQLRYAAVLLVLVGMVLLRGARRRASFRR